MRKQDATFLAISLALIAFSATYYLRPPAPRYYPLTHTWKMGKVAGEPSMGWYGRSAWGLGSAFLIGILAYAAARRGASRERSLPAWMMTMLTICTLVALLAISAAIIHHEIQALG